jgi:hypothetical protein
VGEKILHVLNTCEIGASTVCKVQHQGRQRRAGQWGVPEVSIFLSAAGAISSSLSLPLKAGNEGRYLNGIGCTLQWRQTRISDMWKGQ